MANQCRYNPQRRSRTDLNLNVGLLQSVQDVLGRLNERDLRGVSLEVVEPPELQRIEMRQIEQQTLVQVRVGRRLECVSLLLEIGRQQQNAIVGMRGIVLGLRE